MYEQTNTHIFTSAETDTDDNCYSQNVDIDTNRLKVVMVLTK